MKSSRGDRAMREPRDAYWVDSITRHPRVASRCQDRGVARSRLRHRPVAEINGWAMNRAELRKSDVLFSAATPMPHFPGRRLRRMVGTRRRKAKLLMERKGRPPFAGGHLVGARRSGKCARKASECGTVQPMNHIAEAGGLCGHTPALFLLTRPCHTLSLNRGSRVRFSLCGS